MCQCPSGCPLGAPQVSLTNDTWTFIAVNDKAYFPARGFKLTTVFHDINPAALTQLMCSYTVAADLDDFVTPCNVVPETDPVWYSNM